MSGGAAVPSLAAMIVNPQALIDAGAEIDAQSQTLIAAHRDAEADLNAASCGWVGRSGLALAAKVAEWATFTADLTERLSCHGEQVRMCAVTFAEMDCAHAAALREVGQTRGAAPGGSPG